MVGKLPRGLYSWKTDGVEPWINNTVCRPLFSSSSSALHTITTGLPSVRQRVDHTILSSLYRQEGKNNINGNKRKKGKKGTKFARIVAKSRHFEITACHFVVDRYTEGFFFVFYLLSVPTL
jgi:hypothetical protein